VTRKIRKRSLPVNGQVGERGLEPPVLLDVPPDVLADGEDPIDAVEQLRAQYASRTVSWSGGNELDQIPKEPLRTPGPR